MTPTGSLRLLRTAHGWIGLWGATLGLLFGFTGILLNHRTLMKIPAGVTQESSIELTLPAPPPGSAQALADWLQHELKLERAADRVRVEPARQVAWGDQSLRQPERWQFNFSAPHNSLQAEYWAGNAHVSVKRSANNLYATLMNLHKGVGMDAAWILFADSIAGSILLLSLSGVMLWTRFERGRFLGACLTLVSLGLGLMLALAKI